MPAPDVLHLRNHTPAPLCSLIDSVWANQDDYLRWPANVHDMPLIPGCVRVPYHPAPDPALRLRLAAVPHIVYNRLSNGPAIAAFQIAGGERPVYNNRGWPIHHIYDNHFPSLLGGNTLNAVQDGQHFTHAGGLVAIHPALHDFAHHIPYFAWLLRFEAFQRFAYNPDGIEDWANQ